MNDKGSPNPEPPDPKTSARKRIVEDWIGDQPVLRPTIAADSEGITQLPEEHFTWDSSY